MKIASSELQFSSRHSAVTKHTVEESLRMWVGDRRPETPGPSAREIVQISPGARAALEAERAAAAEPDSAVEGDPRLQLVKLMVEALTGRRIEVLRLQGVRGGDPVPAAAPERRAGFGVEYERRETHYEAEQTNFTAQGVVRTADGREIRFHLELAMSREYSREKNLSLRLGDAVKKDPLVINFDGTAAQLTGARFAFDLDADGAAEEISFVGAGSGFLALDKNGDGVVNDGSELFGPRTGDGFRELAAYDQDGNAWIDESDAVFDALRIWTKDAAGGDRLATLSERGVGAISLARVATPFSLKDGANALLGEVRTTGVYLTEGGAAGSIQQLDLAA